jgi:hypothetical protein
MNEELEPYDVVVDVLSKHAQELWKMTERNMRSEYIGTGIMDDIRLKQIEQIDLAIRVWKTYNAANKVDTKDESC